MQRRQRPDPATYIGRGKVEELREIVVATGRRHGHLRRRARARPAAQPGGQGQGQGDRPDLADPGHLRLPRQERGGSGPGRAGPAAVPQAAAAGLGWQPLPAGRWSREWRGRHRWPWSRRDEAGDRPSTDPQPDREAAGHPARAGRQPAAQAGRAPPPPGPVRGDRRLHQRRQVQRAEPAHRGRGAGRGRAVRHAGSDHPTHPDRRWSGLHADRHRRLRPPPAARPGRGVLLHVGGVGAGRPAGARGRRVRSRTRSVRSRPCAACWPTSGPATCRSWWC